MSMQLDNHSNEILVHETPAILKGQAYSPDEFTDEGDFVFQATGALHARVVATGFDFPGANDEC